MTSPLDDALNSSAPLFHPPQLLVDWEETPPTEGDGVENLYDLSDMLTGVWNVEHSFDDALPDPVTMTTGNDASGKLVAGLLGREGMVLGSASTGGTVVGSNDYDNTAIPIPLPGGVVHGDYVVCGFMVPSSSVQVSEQYDVDPNRRWTRLAAVSDGAFTLFVYGRHHYNGMVAPSFQASSSMSYVTWATRYYRATAPNGDKLKWKARVITGTTPSSATTHVLGDITATKGYVTGFWGANAGITWSGTASGSISGQDQTITTSLAMTQTGYILDPATYPFSLNTNVATATAMYVGLVMTPFERPRMSPTQFWSPFNSDSPVVGFDRDTATVQFNFRTVTSAGVESTTVFFGIMADIGLQAGSAVGLQAVSRLRINLNRSVSLPLVYGRRENCTIDYLVAWILARADRFIGPAPSYMSRYWVPFYGSVHAAQDSPRGYNYAIYSDPDVANGSVYYPRIVEGPFHTAMWACHTQNFTHEIVCSPMELYAAKEVMPPWVGENFIPGQYLQDQFSGTNAVGRISFWLRGDPAYTGQPVNVGSGNNYLFQYRLEALTSTGTILGRVWITLSPLDRKWTIQMGTQSGGYAGLVWPSGLDLPTDNNWHFFSIAWNWWTGSVSMMRDGTTSASNYWGANGLNNTTGWYTTDKALYDAGGKIDNTVRSHLPISDLSIDASWEVYDKNFTDQWPLTPWPSFTAYARPTMSPVEIVEGGEPVSAWDTLASLARNVMAYYRANEWDGFEFFPPEYFGESAQQTPDTVADTEVNAQELDIKIDPSKSRNEVTVKFEDKRVDLTYSPALNLSSVVIIPPGTSDQIFTLDEPIAEIHGALNPYGSTWTVYNLTPAQVAAGTAYTTSHSMTVNTLPDGSGAVTGSLSVSARVIDYTSTTVTVRFLNKTGKTYYLANNYQGDNQLPVMRILGYVVRSADAYVTETDSGAVGVRRQRSLETEMQWVTDRPTALQLASALVTQLARPRPEVKVQIQGDPRRAPGQMVTLADAQETRAAGNWRILSVGHDGSGAQYLQTLQLAYVPPVGVWDTTNWDDSIWGE